MTTEPPSSRRDDQEDGGLPQRARDVMIVVRPAGARPVTYSDVDFAISEETAAAIAAGTPENTTRAYDRVWGNFARWCADSGRVIMPATPQTLCEYVYSMIGAQAAPATVDQAVGAIRSVHRQAGYPGQPDTEEVMKILRGYRRAWSVTGHRVRKRSPLLPADLEAMIATCDLGTPAGLRDRAILLLGFDLMARRSELAALDLPDIEDVPGKGIHVFIGSSKTDKDARGVQQAVAFRTPLTACPVRAVRAWTALLAERGLRSGPLFRPVDLKGLVGGEPGKAGTRSARLTGRAVSDIIGRRAAQAGLTVSSNWGGHSIRAGAATAAHDAGAYITSIARQGRWNERSTVLLGYIRAADDWEHNAMKDVKFTRDDPPPGRAAPGSREEAGP